MSYELLRQVDIDLGELGDSLQIEIDKEKKHLRLTLFQDDHYLNHITKDYSIFCRVIGYMKGMNR